MAEDGYITQAVADAAKQKPIITAGRPSKGGFAAFYLEDVRQHLEEHYGAKRLYESGLAVYTSIDPKLQRIAETAFDAGLRRGDSGERRSRLGVSRLRGSARPRAGQVEECGRAHLGRGREPVQARGADSQGPRRLGGPCRRRGATGALHLRAGSLTVEVPRPGYAWTRKTTPEFLRAGDVVQVRLTAVDATTGFATGELEQDPQIEGSLVAIDNATGQIRAMIGGFDFGRSKFNRATQAWRQMGSTFKPIVYTAAIDRGYTPTSIIVDAPVAFPAGPGQPLYSPQNYDRKFEGAVTLRRALEDSRNVPTVKLLDSIGPAVAIDYARRFGFSNKFQPYLSMALGVTEETLLEATSAYTAFPHQGIRMSPYEVLRVVDRQGNVLEENHPEPNDAIRADTAYVMTSLLEGVTLPAAAVAALDWPIGKTGTMDEYRMRFMASTRTSPSACGSGDEKKPLGPGETGAARRCRSGSRR
jgi:penicillin-binding protein 1A